MAVKPAEEKGAEYAPQVTLSGEGANAEFFKKKKILFSCACVREGFDKLSLATVEFRCKDRDLSLKELVGKPMNFDLPGDDEKGIDGRVFLGTCVSAKYIGTVNRFAYFSAEVRPWLWFLTLRMNSRVFQNKTILQIVTDIIGEHGFSANLKNKLKGYKAREYCIQYRETDYDFIKRLMEEEGVYYYFSFDKKIETLVLCDGPNSHKPMPNGGKLEYRGTNKPISYDTMSDREQATIGEVTIIDYDFENPSAQLKAVKKDQTGKYANNAIETYQYPGNFYEAKLGNDFARVKMEAISSEYQIWRGVSRSPSILVGSTFKSIGNERKISNDDFLLKKSVYYIICDIGAFLGEESEAPIQTLLRNIEISDGVFTGVAANKFMEGSNVESAGSTNIGLEFHCLFEALPKKTQYRAQLETNKPEISSVQTATVVGPKGEEVHTDKFGRVKIEFHWDREGKKDDKSSCWVRVMMPWTGKKWGMINIPRIGQEVVVQFEEGNPDRPIIIGMLYNGATMPPYALPANKTQSGMKTNSSPKGGGFNELLFEDKKDAEFIRFQSERDFKQIIKNNAEITIGLEHKKNGDLETTVHGDIKETSKTGNHTFMIEKGNQNVLINKNQSILIEQGNQTTIIKKGDMIIEIVGGKGLIDAKDEIKLVVGKSSIKIDKKSITLTADQINLTAKKDIKNTAMNVTIAAKTNLKMSATNAKIDAKAKVDVNAKAAVNIAAKGQTKIEGAMTEVAGKGMVTIKGGMTMIN